MRVKSVRSVLFAKYLLEPKMFGSSRIKSKNSLSFLYDSLHRVSRKPYRPPQAHDSNLQQTNIGPAIVLTAETHWSTRTLLRAFSRLVTAA